MPKKKSKKIKKKKETKKIEKDKEELEKKEEKSQNSQNLTEFEFQLDFTTGANSSMANVPVLKMKPKINTATNLEDSLVEIKETSIQKKSDKKEEKLYVPINYNENKIKYFIGEEKNLKEETQEFKESIIGPLHKKWRHLHLRERNKIEFTKENQIQEMLKERDFENFEEIAKYDKKYIKLERDEVIERPEKRKNKIEYYGIIR